MDYKELAVQLMESQFRLSIIHNNISNLEQVKGERGALGFICHSGGPVAPSTLAKEFNVSTARMANVLNSLEKKGYIKREMDTKDRRKINVTATEKGQEAEKRHFEEGLAKVTLLLEKLGEEDAVEHIRIMNRIADIVTELEGR